MNDEQILLDAAYIKLRNNEPMSLIDFQRLANLFETASFGLNIFDESEKAGIQSKFILMLQERFMKGNQVQ